MLRRITYSNIRLSKNTKEVKIIFKDSNKIKYQIKCNVEERNLISEYEDETCV